MDITSSTQNVHNTEKRLEGLHEQEKQLRDQISAISSQTEGALRDHLIATRKAHLERGGTMLVTSEELMEIEERDERRSVQFAQSEAASEADVQRVAEETPSFMSAQNRTLQDIVAAYAGQGGFLEWEVSDDDDDDDDEMWPHARPVYKNPDLWEDAQQEDGLVAFVSKEQARNHSFHFNEVTGEAKVNFEKWEDEMRTKREVAEPAQPRSHKRRKTKAAPVKVKTGPAKTSADSQEATQPAASDAPVPKSRPGCKTGYVRTIPYFGFVLEGLPSMGEVCTVCMEILSDCKCACTACKNTTREACQQAGCRIWGVGDEEVDAVHLSTCKSPYSQDNTDWPRVVAAHCSVPKRAMLYMQAARDAGYKSTPIFGSAKDRTGACSMCRRHVRRISTRKCPWCAFCNQYMRERMEQSE